MKDLLTIGALLLLHAAQAGPAHDHVHGSEHVLANHAFVQNQGQWKAPFLYRAEVNGAALFVEQNGWTWAKLEESASDRMHDFAELSREDQRALQFNGHAWRMRFVGGSAESRPKGIDRAAHDIHFFLGNDKRAWQSHVGAFRELVRTGVWPGIDVVLKTVGNNVKYDVLVAPGANAALVALGYDGLENMMVGENGDLVMRTSVGDVTELAPVAFYGDKLGGSIPCRFDLQGSTVRFIFPDGYNTDRPVVIDPELVAGTYSGATGASNYGHCAAFDNSGNIYTAGRNFGPTYPTTVGAFQTTMGGGGTDISLSKYNPDGSELIWAAYLGGSGGENPHSLVTNSLGELIVLGSSASSNFPVTDGAFDATVNDDDITITHISADGSSLIGSTYLGGSGSDGLNNMFANYGETYRGEVFTDALGNIIIASFSNSADFPVTAGAFQPAIGGDQDGVIVKMDPTCAQLLASTFIGGTSNDNVLGVRLAANGDIFVTGSTESSDLPMPTGGFMDTYQGGDRDGFVLRYTSDLTAVVAGTFFGTTSSDRPYFIDLDSGDNVWIFGQSEGAIPIFPVGTYGAVGGEIFLAKLTGDLTDAPITTTIQGSVTPVAFLVDVCDKVYISGYGVSGAVPTTSDALYTNGGFYLAVFEVGISDILFGTFYGGSHVDGGTSRFDKNGFVYQGVCSGGQSMQAAPWAYATSNQTGWDISVFKIDFEASGVQANITASTINGCVPAVFDLAATGQAVEYTWDLGNGSPLQTGDSITATFNEVGSYLVMLIGTDPESCNLADTAYITLNVYDPNRLLASFLPTAQSTCDGYFLELENTSSGATQYTWDFGDGASSSALEPAHEYAAPGSYTVFLEIRNTVCADTASSRMPVSFILPQLPFDPPTPVAICPESNAVLDAGQGFDSYAWSTGSQASSIQVDEVGMYEVSVTDGFCEAMDSIEVVEAPVHPLAPDVFTCAGLSVAVTTGFPVTSILWSNGAETPSISVAQNGTYSFTGTDAFGCDVEGDVRVINLPSERGGSFIPNIFTPNGDNKNDQFEVVALGLQEFRMEVYDRWGLKMYETSDQGRGWNGGLDNARAAVVPDGTYYYIIEFKDLCSDEPLTTKAGHVTLLR